MVLDIVVDVSELRKKYSKEVVKLTKFLSERSGAAIESGDQRIKLLPGKKGEFPKKDYLRVLLKKYLHERNLKEEFRLISFKENTLMIKERKSAKKP